MRITSSYGMKLNGDLSALKTSIDIYRDTLHVLIPIINDNWETLSEYEFATKYPNPLDRLGKIQPVSLDSNPNLKIFNAYTQLYYGNSAKTKKVYTDENKLIDALTRFDQRAKQDNQPAYVPAKIGCGLAGGDWNRIKKHILDNTSITIVELPQRQPEKTITKETSDELSL